MDLFWSGWEPATMRFNEMTAGGFITQPANTWTNLSYLAVALGLIFWYGKKGDKSLLAYFSVSAILVGLSSFLYHASSAFFFQVFDLASMYLLSAFLLSANLKRLTDFSGRWGVVTIILGAGLPVLVLLLVRGKIGAVLFGIEILLALALELMIVIRARAKTSYRDLGLALLFFSVAMIFWILDQQHLLFRPENHVLQGHALWHIINAFCYVFLYRFYLQFGKRNASSKVKGAAL